MPKRPNLIAALFGFIGLSLACPLGAEDEEKLVVAPADLEVASGFQVDLIYTVPKDEQGSWVGLTVDSKARLIASDQYGSLYRISLPSNMEKEKASVAKLSVRLPAIAPDIPESELGAHGVLYAFDSLYVMVNEISGKRGIWRLRDTTGDDQFDQADYLVQLDGSGEHGPHSMVVSPDGKSIYFCAGNFTDPPKMTSDSRGVRWEEDHLLPRMWDARGHAKGRYAPGGWVGRCDPDGKNVEIFAHGFRNHFDIAFDQNGELFTFDSDMEWDQGSPWYMPTRINHVVDGADFGWRSGAGRWPAYFVDSLAATVEIGPGSPTGVTVGTGTKFPAKYQRALFAADWTYGTLYAIHHTPDGATFKGVKEEFVAGKPLPLTDVIVNPYDGALYFAIGGRRTQSGLYRVSYIGDESTTPAKALDPTPQAILRRELEAYHSAKAGPEAVAFAWPHLSSPDRNIRWAARVAIERQPTSNWIERASAEKDPQAVIEVIVALARVGEKRYQPDIISALEKIDFQNLEQALQLPLLRAWQLVFTRMGEPDTSTKRRIVKLLETHFPHEDRYVNRELLELLVYLDSETIVAKAVPLLKVAEPIVVTGEELGGASLIARNDSYGEVVKKVEDSRPDRQQIAIAYRLRHATTGWTPELRREFFKWFSTTHKWKGGASFSGFLQNIRNESLENFAPADERTILEEASKPPPHAFVSGSIPPVGPGQLYTVDSAMALMPKKLRNRDFERGRSMFASTACVACHRFAGEGGGIGPDISGAGNRYSQRDLLENIIEPSKVVSDQYSFEEIKLNNGDVIIGRVVGENGDFFHVMTNPMLPDEVKRIGKQNVAERKLYPLSIMPPGLINGLNPEELQDLLAYLLSGGNRQDSMFKK